nr:hypothetical protein [Lachnospiraceae bacterium]
MRKLLEKLSGPKKVMAGVCAATVVGTSIGVCYMNSTTVEAEETSVNAQSEEVDLAEDDTEVILSKLLTKSVENASGAEVDKEETVYIIGDANGENPEIIVTDWLRNPSASATIDDVTTLSDVTNLKGDEVYTPQSGDEVIWAADGNDIHYQGSTDAQLPILVKVTYFLDGKEIAPEDLAGKSGHVKIRLDYTNNATTQITVADREETINVPFGVMSGMLLDTDKFYNISVKNGKVVDQGNIAMVVGLAFPGLMESLDVDQDLLEDMTIPDYIEVEADTTDFALDMTLSVAMTDALSEFTLDPDALNSDELNDAIDELSDASTQLVDGTGELSDGVSELSDGTAELKDGTSSLLDGATALKEGADSLDGGMQTLFCGIRTYTDGVKNLKEGMGELKYASTLLYNGAAQIGSYMSSLKAGIDSLNSSVTKLHTLSTLSSSYNTQKLTSCVYAAQSYLPATEKAYLSQALSSSDGMTMFVMATKVMEMLDANLLADHGYSLNTAVAAQMAQGASAQAVIGAMVQSALTQYASSGLTLSSAQQSALIEYCYITYLIATNDTTLHGAVTTS